MVSESGTAMLPSIFFFDTVSYDSWLVLPVNNTKIYLEILQLVQVQCSQVIYFWLCSAQFS